jgi:hypothetical protein
MQDRSAAQAFADFAARYGNMRIQSTGAAVVSHSGPLYNVDGSTPDPKIAGVTWKQLLINHGIGSLGNNHCYATTPLPGVPSSHPSFDVGGHVTTNSSGAVGTGGFCYLMPLCTWHNSTARNHQPFSPSPKVMLKLTGYMQAELAATFVARLPTDAPYTLVGAHGTEVFTADLEQPQVGTVWASQKDAVTGGPFPEHYLLFRQIRENGTISYVLEDAQLPDRAPNPAL